VRKIAGLSGDWTMRAFKEQAIEKVRAEVGKGRVICGLSGGRFRGRGRAHSRGDR
jgi:GMP synthase (glutamine-hydrolysing)